MNLDDCIEEVMSGKSLLKLGTNEPMTVWTIPDRDNIDLDSKYKVWIYYRDGWGCLYANVVKWDKVIE